MNHAFLDIIAAPADERRDLFLRTARRLGTAIQNVEKDFWVCWTLDALFTGLPPGGPRLLFKGGTSLSKAYGLIERFSEDIDVTVFRKDLGHGTTVEELEAMSRKKRQVRLDEIRKSCQMYLRDGLLVQLGHVIEDTMYEAGIESGTVRLVLDDADPDRQTLVFWYPTTVTVSESYVRSAVKIESGAKSALDPHRTATVMPYVAAEVPHLNLRVDRVTTVDPERTFWDKLIILHGLRSWFERRKVLRHDGQRISRHYYDISRLLASPIASRAIYDRALAVDCARHARMFFYRPDLDLEHAVPGTLTLVPTEPMLDALRRDYDAMAGMIFGVAPAFEQVVEAVAELEARINTIG